MTIIKRSVEVDNSSEWQKVCLDSDGDEDLTGARVYFLTRPLTHEELHVIGDLEECIIAEITTAQTLLKVDRPLVKIIRAWLDSLN